MLLSLIFLGIAICNIPLGVWNLAGDASQYIILAKSIISGKGYINIADPGGQFFYMYPPVFPLLLAPILYFIGQNFFLMHILVVLFGCAVLLLAYKLFKQYLDKDTAFWVTAFLGTNWMFIRYASHYILSDVPCMFFIFLALWSAAKYFKQPGWLSREGIILGLGLIFSFFTRYAAIALFASLVFFLLAEKITDRWKKLTFIFLSFIIPFGAWQVISRIFSPEAVGNYSALFTYTDPYNHSAGSAGTGFLSFLITRLSNEAAYYLAAFGFTLNFGIIGRYNLLIVPLSLFMLFFVFWGFMAHYRKYPLCAFNYFFLVYLVMILFWFINDVNESFRYLLPILPFIIFYFLISIKSFADWLALRFFPDRASHKFLSSGGAVLIVMFFVVNISSLLSPLAVGAKVIPGSSADNFISVNNFITRKLNNSGVVVSRRPSFTYLITDHKSFVYPYTSDSEEIWKKFKSNKARYVILDELSLETQRYLLPCLVKHRDQLKLLYSAGGTVVCEIKYL